MSFLYDFAFLLVALLALGFTIFIHELGHFLAARQRGLIIKRFSIGFGPKIFGWEKDGVEYRISMFPFGGYVALPQLADMGRVEGQNEESQGEKLSAWDDYDDDEDENEDELKEKKPPKISYADKMIVSVMGAVFNILLAFTLSSVLWFFGYERRDGELTTKIGYIADTVERWNPIVEQGETVTSPAKKAGLLPGDQVLSVDGAPVEDFMDVQSRIVTGKLKTAQDRRLTRLTILRNNEKKDIEVFPEVFGTEEIRIIGIGPKETFFIKELQPDMPAIKAGLEEGDQLVSVDGIKIFSFAHLVDYLMKLEDGKEIALTVRKGGESGLEQTYNLLPVEKDMQEGNIVTKRKLIGFSPRFKTITTYPNPLLLIVSRVKDMYHTLTGLVSPQSDVKLRNMSGPVGIVNNLSIFASIGFKKLLWFVVFINVNLAILNLLPIPVLDGGHMVFATIEKLRGKPLPVAFLERSQMLFVVLLFSFMLYVTFFDFQRLFPF
ncbi:RIP metalloprotease RseP [Opitutales bacterium]|nr:RIP metalloprotease RseP [Opitutales bacterium]